LGDAICSFWMTFGCDFAQGVDDEELAREVTCPDCRHDLLQQPHDGAVLRISSQPVISLDAALGPWRDKGSHERRPQIEDAPGLGRRQKISR
jgi:hypothetical protein